MGGRGVGTMSRRSSAPPLGLATEAAKDGLPNHPARHGSPLRVCLDSESSQEFVELVERTVVDDQASLPLLHRLHLHAHAELAGERLLQVLDMGRRGGCFGC